MQDSHYDVKPLSHPIDTVVSVPGSKSITNRALILATLAQGNSPSLLQNALKSVDTEVMLSNLQQLGISIEADWSSSTVSVRSTPITGWKSQGNFFCGNSGTTIRFLTATLALGNGTYRLDGVPRMRQRPIADLLEALQQLNVRISSVNNDGCPPVYLEAQGIQGGTVHIRSDVSSQFLSAMLLAAPYAASPITLKLEGPMVSEPYIEMTLAMMQQWGVTVSREASNRFFVKPQHYLPQKYAIEPDASSASYFWAAAAITGGRIRVPGLTQSLQGDTEFLKMLVKMGCRLEGSEVLVGQPLHGIDVDMNAISDTVMTLAVVALFAEGKTTIRNVAHIRHKETDRLSALAHELRKVGAGVEEHEDGLTIHPAALHGATLETYDDHRMAMSLALIGLRVSGITILNPECTNKTFPTFWRTLESLQN